MIDPVLIEVLRCKLEAIADDGARTVQRTAISPVVADAGDCSCAIFDSLGRVIVGDSLGSTGSNGVTAILDRHGSTLAPGDIFLVNDPYNGGGFHAQDVFIHIPIFAEGQLVAWVGASAHMMDMGGLVPGSFSPAATECYQEALRFPPVRLARAHEECTDIWAILRVNIRVSDLVEMDMRALIAGCNVIVAEIGNLMKEYSVETFAATIEELNARSEQEMLRRIGTLEPGVYRSVSWAEWSDEIYRIPCELTVSSDGLLFDFSGASPQTLHYYNSKPYIIRNLLGVEIATRMAIDLPFNDGILRTFEVRCEPGSILDASAPAPIGGPHLEVGQTAIEVATNCLTLAMAASDATGKRWPLAGSTSLSGLCQVTWSGQGNDGRPDAWLMIEGAAVGSSAGVDRDGIDLYSARLSRPIRTEQPDTEVLESWYPLFFERRAPARGARGAGEHRAGRAISSVYRTTGERPLVSAILGNRERVPIIGFAGGRPGGVAEFWITGNDGERRRAPFHSQGVTLSPGEVFELEVPTGGGWGDPLDRNPEAILREVRLGRVTPEEAKAVYGVVAGDDEATAAERARIRQDRLKCAEPARRPCRAVDPNQLGEPSPLYPGVEQRGAFAFSVRTGAALAESPDHWTDGCPVLREISSAKEGVQFVTYLDPGSGSALATDVVAEGLERGFATLPLRWVNAGARQTRQVERAGS